LCTRGRTNKKQKGEAPSKEEKGNISTVRGRKKGGRLAKKKGLGERDFMGKIYGG